VGLARASTVMPMRCSGCWFIGAWSLNVRLGVVGSTRCRYFTGCPPRNIPEVVSLGEKTPRSVTRKYKKHKIWTGSGREVRNTLRPVWWFVFPWCRSSVLNGSLPPLYIREVRVTWILANISQEIVPGYNSSSFLLYRLALSPTQTSRKQHK
jgi:hypothetical protein